MRQIKLSNNSITHPEAWDFYINEARNIEEEPSINHLGKYRIPIPDESGNFIYADDTANLWREFIKEWYKPRLNSSSVYGKIQYIVTNF